MGKVGKKLLCYFNSLAGEVVVSKWKGEGVGEEEREGVRVRELELALVALA